MSEAELEKLRDNMMLLYHLALNYGKTKICFILKGEL